MRVARGMFRLWLVLSALYVAAVVIVYYRTVANEFEVASMVANVGPWTKYQANRPDFTTEQRQALENAARRLLAAKTLPPGFDLDPPKPNFFDQFDPSPHPWAAVLRLPR